jgi:prevent-host-death family protein
MEIKAAEFRSNFFKILDQVKTTHTEVVITKRGKPISKLIPIVPKDQKDPFLGALAGLGKTVGDLTQPVTSHQDWEID